ncbi:hypothetical protein BdWA1_002110 [Babesia duncani]|uniref:Uncharacterized protein n=1 Tax=Babesia duncani TaxID=323732 RepID=A0AAD9PL49_9APIC|nr:hypothetical protein BdWA1_002110 [Babesia duncani]
MGRMFVLWAFMLLGLCNGTNEIALSQESWKIAQCYWVAQLLEHYHNTVIDYKNATAYMCELIAEINDQELIQLSSTITKQLYDIKADLETQEQKAKDFAKEKSKLTVEDANEFNKILDKYYESYIMFVKSFNSTWKKLNETYTNAAKKQSITPKSTQIVAAQMDGDLAYLGISLIKDMIKERKEEWYDGGNLDPYQVTTEATIENLLKQAKTVLTRLPYSRTIEEIKTATEDTKTLGRIFEDAMELFHEYKTAVIKRYKEKNVTIDTVFVSTLDYKIRMGVYHANSIALDKSIVEKGLWVSEDYQNDDNGMRVHINIPWLVTAIVLISLF